MIMMGVSMVAIYLNADSYRIIFLYVYICVCVAASIHTVRV